MLGTSRRVECVSHKPCLELTVSIFFSFKKDKICSTVKPLSPLLVLYLERIKWQIHFLHFAELQQVWVSFCSDSPSGDSLD